MTTYAEAPSIDEVVANIQNLPISKIRRALESIEHRNYGLYSCIAHFFREAEDYKPEWSYSQKYDRRED